MSYKDLTFTEKWIAQDKVKGEGLVLRLKSECEDILKRGYDVNTTSLTKIEAIIEALYDVEEDAARHRKAKLEEDMAKIETEKKAAEEPIGKDDYNE